MSLPRRGAGLWELSGIAAGRFSDLPYARYVLPVPGRRQMVRLMLFTAMAWGGWRANDSRTAVCGLTGAPGPRLRVAALAMWLFAGLAAFTAWVAWMALWSAVGLMLVPLFTFFGFAGLVLVLTWRAARVGKAKAQLPKFHEMKSWAGAGPFRRTSHHLEVHIVASKKPGEGRALLEAVADEADRNGWALTLDASNDRLAAYYQDLGFDPIGLPAAMPFGERVTRLVRPPAR